MTKREKVFLYLMMAGLSILLILRDVYGLVISKYIFLGYVFVCMYFANYKTLVAMICFMLPLVCGLPGTYIMPIALAFLFIKRRVSRMIQFVPLCILLFLELFASFWYPSLEWQNIINYISFAGVMIYLVNDETEADYSIYVKTYLLGFILLSLVIVIVTLENAPKNWMKRFAEGLFRFGGINDESSGMKLTLNANSLAYYSLTGIFCSIFLAEATKGVKKFVYIAVAVFSVAIGFLTLSRSWVMVATICMILYVISKLHNIKQFVRVVSVIVAIVVVVLLVVDDLSTLFSGFLLRFGDDTMEYGGSRAYIFQKYMTIYFSDVRYIFFGTGVTQTNAVVGTSGSVHNGVQQILVCTGIFGFAMYMFVLLKPVLQFVFQKRVSFVFMLPMICVIVFTQTIQFLNPTMLMLPYIIGMYTIRAGGQKNENIPDNSGYGRGQPLALETRQRDYH